MIKHTPVPWKVIGRSIYQTEAVGGREVIHGSGIKGRDSEDRNRQDVINEAEANARFIVTACNSYASLLEALKMLVADYEEIGGDALYDDAYRQAKEEIRKAEEQMR